VALRRGEDFDFAPGVDAAEIRPASRSRITRNRGDRKHLGGEGMLLSFWVPRDCALPRASPISKQLSSLRPKSERLVANEAAAEEAAWQSFGQPHFQGRGEENAAL